MSPKSKLTKTLYSHLSNPPYTEQEAMIMWWANIKATGGFKLTKFGFEVFKKELDLESHTLEVNPTEVTTKFLLNLDKKITTPYYLEKKRIHLFGTADAVNAIMHGSISQYLHSLTYFD